MYVCMYVCMYAHLWVSVSAQVNSVCIFVLGCVFFSRNLSLYIFKEVIDR